jgi:hypothetical protein
METYFLKTGSMKQGEKNIYWRGNWAERLVKYSNF